MKNQPENTENTSSVMVDITAFDAVADSEIGIDIPMKKPNGEDSGVIFTIIGKNADAVQSWTKKIFAAMQREENLAKRRGKEIDLDVEKLKDQNRDGACVRVIGWKNVSQPFDKALLKQVLIKNPHWVEQITEESNDLANFTKSN